MDDQPVGTIVGQGWDEPWYRVRTEAFQASFLPGAGEDLEAVCNVDAEVQLTADGSRWSATLFTVTEVERLMKRWSHTGEERGGSYFWCSDALIVGHPGIGNMTRALIELIDAGDLGRILQRLDGD
ncbi:hypothetical protein ABZV64_21830 [Streptomyces sp. NPDC004959]|uniref:hypothetical protein n=1 Tax=Streptomyces sp. NPDC004959 TaxID=3154673 RepID=UPI0033AEDC1D